MLMHISGTDTTAYTIYSGVYLMGMYPEIQDKVQKELDDVIQDG